MKTKLILILTVLGGAIASITQDYLSGGEHTEILVGECDAYWHWITPPPSGT